MPVVRVTSDDSLVILLDGQFVSVESGQYVCDLAAAVPDASVTSFAGRTGDVTPEAGDYSATQVSYGLGSNVGAAIDALGGTSLPLAEPVVLQIVSFAASAGARYFCDATAGNIIVAPPAAPAVDDRVGLSVAAGGGNVVRFDAGSAGQALLGLVGASAVWDMDAAGDCAVLVWTGTPTGWIVA